MRKICFLRMNLAVGQPSKNSGFFLCPTALAKCILIKKGFIMKKLILFASFFVLFVSTACGMTTNFNFQTIEGSGKIATESREVAGFERVEVCCGMELFLIQGNTESLKIEADDNLMDDIATSVVGNRLEIKYREMNNVSYQPSKAVKLYLTVKDLRGVSISGGGYFETETISSESFDLALSGGSDAQIGVLTTGNVDVNISGGGKLEANTIDGDQIVMGFSGGSDAQTETLKATSVNVGNSGGGAFEVDVCEVDRLDISLSGSSNAQIMDLTAQKLNLEASGGGVIRMAGVVAEQDISLSGGSSLRAGDLQSEATAFSASGGGDSTVWATETLSAHLMGGSSLDYYGLPEITEQGISGGGDLESLGER
jgi:hypothetical protein